MLSAAGLAVQKELGSIRYPLMHVRGDPVQPPFPRRTLRRAQGERLLL